MRLSLKAGEKIYVNGAVFSVDRRVSIDILNDVTFLLQAHVMQLEEAVSPLRQLYFAIQLMLMEPDRLDVMKVVVEDMFDAYDRVAANLPLQRDVAAVRDVFGAGRLVESLKGLRRLFAQEAAVLDRRSAVHETRVRENADASD